MENGLGAKRDGKARATTDKKLRISMITHILEEHGT